MEITDITADLARSFLPERAADAHKGTFGHLFIIAGSRRFTGAPRMVALGALRSGVGLATVGCPAAISAIISSALLESMILELPPTRNGAIAEAAVGPALSFAKDKEAVVVGPGLGMLWDTREFVVGFLRNDHPPAVVDADGLNAVAEHSAFDGLKNCVITPHPGEMGRLMNMSPKDVQGDRAAAAANCAQRTNAVTVLKGHGTIVALPDGQCFLNHTGNVGMASGGTGDVLAGMIGALLAQGLSPADAARVGVFVHGLAGDIAVEKVGARSLIAGDVIDALPTAWQALERR